MERIHAKYLIVSVWCLLLVAGCSKQQKEDPSGPALGIKARELSIHGLELGMSKQDIETTLNVSRTHHMLEPTGDTVYPGAYVEYKDSAAVEICSDALEVNRVVKLSAGSQKDDIVSLLGQPDSYGVTGTESQAEKAARYNSLNLTVILGSTGTSYVLTGENSVRVDK